MYALPSLCDQHNYITNMLRDGKIFAIELQNYTHFNKNKFKFTFEVQFYNL